ncbi:hypothetical protein Oweho_2666 [Owenweeksia hongkongensis DSM 17368]|uniref:SbsA Ig-like domain-containing protein n=1 Tax=Owenweeksia hongkongensis (strain DSM 17368 / CIP 108786 / JCM 12287 / NRRL B-23963 / UST20020801) TaxID=926562 RepID=G8R922_OWEHD|nr:Ig-like domain-containing protein [Owenweeksia hongkongensis]AEV33630.1 hypothetical protein Oweho_2666 [Owenweeksia hongkongensis DSM 17368]
MQQLITNSIIPLNKLLRFLPVFILASAFVYFSSTSCASISSPTGGPRDTLAPQLDTSFPPNFSTNFKASEVILVFDEYITLKSASQQISISPPLSEKLKITSMSREVNISWKDTLLDSTTYIISFGNAITDFTEGNANEKIKYVFSTGNFIDSLEIDGYVYDKEGKPTPDIMVGLYDLKTLEKADSIPFLNLPTYYDYTDENGKFELSNLKYSKFVVVAFQDVRQNFKLNSGAELMGFLSDTITTSLSNESIKLNLFLPEPVKRFYGAKHTGYGKIQFAYSYPIPELTVKALPNNDSLSGLLVQNKTKDSATYWFNPVNYTDSITLQIFQAGTITDTATLLFKEFKAENFTPKLTSNEIRNIDPVVVLTEVPVTKVDTSLIFIYNETDTAGVSIEDSIYMLKQIKLIPQKRFKDFTIKIPQGAITNYFEKVNDTTEARLKTLGRDDLGNLDFVVKTDSTPYPLILRIFTEKDKKVIHESSFNAGTTVKFRNQKPGLYKAELILDKDGNGKWSTGNYLEGKQPEKVLYYSEDIEIRANWDLELEWRIDKKLF